MTDKKPGTTRTLAEVRQQLTDQLVVRARAGAGRRSGARASRSRSRKPADLDTVAKAQGLTVQESGFFARDEPILGLGPSPEVAAARVRDEGRRGVAGAARRRAASCSSRWSAKQDPYVPKLDEVKERVRDEVIKQKARDLSQAEGGRARGEAEGRARLREGRQGRRRRSEDDRAHRARRAAARPGRRAGGRRRGVQAAGRRASAIRSPSTTAPPSSRWSRSRKSTPTDYALAKDKFRDELLADRRSRFFGAYMPKAKQKMKIEVNREALQKRSSVRVGDSRSGPSPDLSPITART